ncbi:MAG TPA: hypothetical protein DIW31_12480 [Bacteroidales bacterium]|nr:hypothetical protein [Bacteroidales bacterium]
MTEVAVITIPANEWNEARALLMSLNEKVNELVDKAHKDMLTPKEVCAMLKIGRTTYDRYVREGIITTTRISNKKYSKVLVKRGDIETLVKNGII